MKFKLVYLFVFIYILQLQATTFEGTGIAKTKEEAIKSALSDLSHNISVEVKSNIKTVKNNIQGSYSKDTKKIVELKSNLPIKSAKFIEDKQSYETTVKAIISSQDSLNGYIVELNRLKKEIVKSKELLDKNPSDDIKYKLLSKLLVMIDDFNRHKIVATMLKGKDLPTLDITSIKIQNDLLKLQNKVNSLKAAAKILTKEMNQESIYVIPVKVDGSNEVTQFAKVFKRQLERKIDAVESANEASYILKGSYEILDGEIFVSLKLLDTKNSIVNSSNILLEKKAYLKYKYKPRTLDFDSAMNSSVVLSGKLRVNIGLKGHNRSNGIDLADGDVIDIIAKTNKEVCYYLQGTTINDDKSYSYILPIGSGNNPYTSYITSDDVNRFITIVSNVQVSHPFGVETLQIFAQTLQNGKCKIPVPYCKNDSFTGLCLLTDKPQKAVVKTRALFTQQQSSNTIERKLQSAEDVLSFTTSR